MLRVRRRGEGVVVRRREGDGRGDVSSRLGLLCVEGVDMLARDGRRGAVVGVRSIVGRFVCCRQSRVVCIYPFKK